MSKRIDEIWQRIDQCNSFGIEEGIKTKIVQQLCIGDAAYLVHRIKKLEKALEFYADMTRLEYPDDWDCFGEGDTPGIKDYNEVDLGVVAREALREDEA